MKADIPFTALVLMAVLMASCAPYRARSDFEAPVKLPASYAARPGTPVAGRTNWWEDFGDEQLSALVAEVLAANLNLQQAWARLSQAEAVSDQTAAIRRPQIGLEGASTRARTHVVLTEPLPNVASVHTRSHSLTLGASYEVDLWERLASGHRAARLEKEATRLDLETMAMSLSAQAAETWFALVAQSSQLRLARSQHAVSLSQLDLVEQRYARGLATALEIYQQRQQLAAIAAQMPLIEARIAVLTHQLNVLRGRPPASVIGSLPEALPALAPLPDPGLPADLLNLRPDVRAAELRIAAADQRVAEAVASRFPQVNLRASRGWGAQSFADLFDRMIWSVTGSIAASVYDGHARNREVDRTRSVVEERLSAYGQTVLEALAEVEDALVGEKAQAAYVDRLSDQLTLAEATLDQARRQYTHGLSDYLGVLTALNALQSTEQELVTARYELISQRVQLCRALGGTWTTKLTRENQTGDLL